MGKDPLQLALRNIRPIVPLRFEWGRKKPCKIPQIDPSSIEKSYQNREGPKGARKRNHISAAMSGVHLEPVNFSQAASFGMMEESETSRTGKHAGKLQFLHGEERLAICEKESLVARR